MCEVYDRNGNNVTLLLLLLVGGGGGTRVFQVLRGSHRKGNCREALQGQRQPRPPNLEQMVLMVLRLVPLGGGGEGNALEGRAFFLFFAVAMFFCVLRTTTNLTNEYTKCSIQKSE